MFVRTIILAEMCSLNPDTYPELSNKYLPHIDDLRKYKVDEFLSAGITPNNKDYLSWNLSYKGKTFCREVKITEIDKINIIGEDMFYPSFNLEEYLKFVKEIDNGLL